MFYTIYGNILQDAYQGFEKLHLISFCVTDAFQPHLTQTHKWKAELDEMMEEWWDMSMASR